MATGKTKTTKQPVEVVDEVVEVKEEIKEKAPVVYVGPTITAIGAITGTVYSDIPVSAEKALEEKPIIKILFATLTEYPEAEREIRERHGIYWNACEVAVEYQANLRR